jgi:hypothetical protein
VDAGSPKATLDTTPLIGVVIDERKPKTKGRRRRLKKGAKNSHVTHLVGLFD